MHNSAPKKTNKDFQKPEETIGVLEADVISDLIAAASDVALVLDSQGIIHDIAFGNDDLANQGFDKWRGQKWTEVVTVESQPKLQELLRDAVSSSPIRWRQVNHPSPKGGDIPIKYTTIKFGENGKILAVGREMQALASLQQRLVETQVSLEREYVKLRNAETRYKLLFQLAAEAVLIVDASTLRILEANPAASAALNRTERRLVGSSLTRVFTTEFGDDLNQFLSKLRESGRSENVPVKLGDQKRPLHISGSLFRQENQSYFLIRIAKDLITDAPKDDGNNDAILDVVAQLPEAFVVTDKSGAIIRANHAFLDLTQMATEEQTLGQTLDRWLGQSDVDMTVILANLREHGAVRRFTTTMRSEFNTTSDVEVSAVHVSNHVDCIGFTIRIADRAETSGVPSDPLVPKSAEQLTRLVGRVPLKNLVQDTTDIIEKLCIESALEMTGNNRASAAEMLGVSRQSLYVKMRRYGIGNLEQN